MNSDHCEACQCDACCSAKAVNPVPNKSFCDPQNIRPLTLAEKKRDVEERIRAFNPDLMREAQACGGKISTEQLNAVVTDLDLGRTLTHETDIRAMPFNIGSAVKLIVRARNKDPFKIVNELKEAIDHLREYIDYIQGK